MHSSWTNLYKACGHGIQELFLLMLSLQTVRGWGNLKLNSLDRNYNRGMGLQYCEIPRYIGVTIRSEGGGGATVVLWFSEGRPGQRDFL